MKKLPPPREVLMKIIIDGFDRALAKDLSPEDRTALLGYRNEFESSFLPMIDICGSILNIVPGQMITPIVTFGFPF